MFYKSPWPTCFRYRLQQRAMASELDELRMEQTRWEGFLAPDAYRHVDALLASLPLPDRSSGWTAFGLSEAVHKRSGALCLRPSRNQDWECCSRTEDS